MSDVAVAPPSPSPARVGGSPLADVQLRLVESLDDAIEMRAWLGERRSALGVDTESEGLVPARHDLRLVQLGDLRAGWAVPWPLWGGLVQEALRRYDGPMVMHHSKFDHAFLRERASVNLPWAHLHDTMIQLALVDPTRPKGLKAAAARLVDKNATAGEKLLHDGMREHGWTWATVPYDFPPYWIYGALDPVLTCHLHESEHPKVAARYRDVYQLELATARVAGVMSSAGLRIDRPYVTGARDRLGEYGQRVRAWLKETYGVTSLMSARQLHAALLQAGFEVTATTPTGLPKVDKETLEGIAKGVSVTSLDVAVEVAATGSEVELSHVVDGPEVPLEARRLAKVIIDARHAEKVITGYLDNFLELAGADDVIHPQINTLQARTGRMSVTDPALQTLHRDDKIVRGCFVPREGHVFVTCDFSQVEMRLAAALSGDEGLIAAFAEADTPGGRDFYSGIASELFREDVSKADPRRQAVKTMSYAKLYGAGLDTMSRSIGLPPARVKVIRDAFDARFPGLARMAKQLSARAYAMKRDGERPATSTTMGRYLPCDPGREFALMNYALQGEAADALKRALVSVANVGLEPWMRLPVHDELILEVPEADAEEALRLTVEAMTDRDTYAVPITCDAKVLRERWVKA